VLASRQPEKPVVSSAPLRRYLPYVLLATFTVAILPPLAVTALQAVGMLRSTLLSIALSILLSVAAAKVGSAFWTRRPGSKDLIFSDLMVWGWIRRLRTERRLGDATELLGRRATLSPDRQAQLLEELSSALEARDPFTHGHSRRVARHAHMIAREMGLPRDLVTKVRTAAAVHDVGKLEVPREIINKPGKLTDEEFATMKRHPLDGAEMVSGMGDPEVTAMVRHHHERLDGRGYPDGLTTADIPLGARIIGVADTFDALTSSRPYRAPSKHKKAIDVLKKEAGSQLDPDAVAAFLSYYSGRRPVAWWAVITTGPPRLLRWLMGSVQGAGAAPFAQSLSSVGAAALIGSSLMAPMVAAKADREESANGRAGQATAQAAPRLATVNSATNGGAGRTGHIRRGTASDDERRRPPGAGSSPGSRSGSGTGESNSGSSEPGSSAPGSGSDSGSGSNSSAPGQSGSAPGQSGSGSGSSGSGSGSGSDSSGSGSSGSGSGSSGSGS